MSDKDYIKDLFQEQLGNLETAVNPELWSGIQAQLGQMGAATGTASTGAVAAKSSVFIKIAIAASVVTAAVIGTVYLTNAEQIEQSNTVEFKSEEQEKQIDLEEQIADNETNLETPKQEITPPPYPPMMDDNQFDLTKEEPHKNNTPIASNNPINANDKSSPDVSSSSSQPSATQPNSSVPETKQEILIANIVAERRDNQHFRFNAESNVKNAKFMWDFGDGMTSNQITTEHFYAKGGNYQVSLTVIDGERAKTVYYSVEIKTPGKFTKLPNIITPNDDGSNDIFFVESEGLQELTIVILNQKNEIVFESNVVDFKWDGRDRRTGERVDKGTYYYMISAIDIDGNALSKHNRLDVNY